MKPLTYLQASKQAELPVNCMITPCYLQPQITPSKDQSLYASNLVCAREALAADMLELVNEFSRQLPKLVAKVAKARKTVELTVTVTDGRLNILWRPYGLLTPFEKHLSLAQSQWVSSAICKQEALTEPQRKECRRHIQRTVTSQMTLLLKVLEPLAKIRVIDWVDFNGAEGEISISRVVERTHYLLRSHYVALIAQKSKLRGNAEHAELQLSIAKQFEINDRAGVAAV